MDDFIIHCRPLPRRHPGSLPVVTIGYFRHKTEWVDRSFASWNFSCILSGQGSYDDGSGVRPVRAPCILTQRPGPHYRYGAQAGASWEELFLIYDAAAGRELAAQGLLPEETSWPLAGVQVFRRVLRELCELLQTEQRQADRIDRCCERLVLEALLAREAADAADPITAIRQQVEADPLPDPDWPALARSQGLSPSHFRRLWQQQVGTPPGRYRTHCLMQRACRLLIETTWPVAAVAEACGFTDPLYFSRRFRATIGSAPSAYRAANPW